MGLASETLGGFTLPALSLKGLKPEGNAIVGLYFFPPESANGARNLKSWFGEG
jgi:hypothetical protein